MASGKSRCRTWFGRKDVLSAVRDATVQPKMQAALDVEREAKTSMQQGGVEVRRSLRRSRTKSGGLRYGRVKVNVPSEPGTPPHVQSGIGRASITYAFVKLSRVVIVGPASPPAPYMGVHEFGSKFHPPRPFMRPALGRVVPRYPKMFRNLPLAKTRAGKKLEQRGRAFNKKGRRRR